MIDEKKIEALKAEHRDLEEQLARSDAVFDLKRAHRTCKTICGDRGDTHALRARTKIANEIQGNESLITSGDDTALAELAQEELVRLRAQKEKTEKEFAELFPEHIRKI